MNKRMVLILLAVWVCAAAGGAFAEDTQQVVFYVAWYDVGKAALEGLPGVLDVTSGWYKFREVNTVVFEPAVISVDEMVTALKRSGTFRGRVAE